MAKPTERRVNKQFVIPSEADKPIIDPGLSELSEDTSIDQVEATRVARYEAQAEVQAQQADEPPTGSQLAAASASEADEHFEELREHAADFQSADTSQDTDVSDVGPMNYP